MKRLISNIKLSNCALLVRMLFIAVHAQIDKNLFQEKTLGLIIGTKNWERKLLTENSKNENKKNKKKKRKLIVYYWIECVSLFRCTHPP